MIATHPDGGRRVGCRHMTGDERLEDREHALRPPVTDPRENGIRKAARSVDSQWCQRPVDQRCRAGHAFDHLEINSKALSRLGQAGVGAQLGAGAQEHETHRLMVTQLTRISESYKVGILER